MDLRKVQYFLAVADLGSFTVAAEKNHISQSALSKHISDLEYELGIRLFTRTKVQVALTPEGSALIPEARRLLADSDNLVSHARTLSRTGSGELRIGYSSYWEYNFLCQTISQFSQQFPYTNFFFYREHHGKMNRLFRHGKYDLILTMRDSNAPLPANTEWFPIATSPLLATVSEHHWLASKDSVTLQDLENERQIIVARENDTVFNALISDAFLSAGLICNYYPYSPENTLDALLLVAANKGIALFTTWMTQMSVPGVHYIPLATPIGSLEFGIAYRADHQSALIQSFLNAIQKNLPDFIKESQPSCPTD